MSELKTKPTDASVPAFVEAVADARMRADCQALIEIMERATGESPRIWGESMVGFGMYRYKYASGREGDWFRAGFSPRKQNITLYLLADLSAYSELLGRLGKHKTSNYCLYIKKLADVDVKVLEELVQRTAASPMGAVE